MSIWRWSLGVVEESGLHLQAEHEVGADADGCELEVDVAVGADG